MNKMKNQLPAKISLYSSIGLLIVFFAIIVIFYPPDKRDRLLIFEHSSNYYKDHKDINFSDIGNIHVEFSYPSNDSRFNISTFPMYIILSHDRKEVKFVTDKIEKVTEYYNFK